MFYDRKNSWNRDFPGEKNERISQWVLCGMGVCQKRGLNGK